MVSQEDHIIVQISSSLLFALLAWPINQNCGMSAVGDVQRNAATLTLLNNISDQVGLLTYG